MYDGSITISTKIDSKGLDSGIAKLQKSLKSLADAMDDAFGTASLANFSKESTKVATGVSQSLQGLQSTIEGVGRSFSSTKTFLQGAGDVMQRLSGAASAVKGTFQSTGEVLPSLSAGFQSVFGSMSNTEKAMTGLVGAVAVFSSAKTVFSELALGSMDLGTAMLNIVPVCAVVGIALEAAMGPMGLVLGAVALLAGAFIGLNEAQEQLQAEFIQADFFDGVGIGLDTLNTYLMNSQRESAALRDHIIGLGQAAEECDAKISEAQIQLGTYQSILSATGTLTADEAAKMETSYKTLIDSLRQNMEFDAGVVFETFTGSSREAAEALGMDVDEMTGILENFKNTFSTKANELETEMQPYWEKLKAGEILTEEDQAQFGELMTYANDLSQTVSTNQVELESQIGNIAKIDFSNTDEALSQLDQITETGRELLGDLDEQRTTALASVETMKHQATVMFEHGDLTESAFNSAMSTFKNYAEGINAGYEADKEEITNTLAAVTGAIEAELDKQIEQTAQSAPRTFGDNWNAAWASFGNGDGLINGDKQIDQVMRDKVEADIGAPIRDKLNSMTSELGVKANKELGRGLIDGLAEGIGENDNVIGAVSSLSDEMESKIREDNGIHSPSELYSGFGYNLVEGLAQGINDGRPAALQAFSSLFNALLEKTEIFCSRFRDSIHSLMDGMTGTMNTAWVGSSGKICYNKMPPIQIPRLATGAVIPPRAEYLAILGDQRSGRNIETPESLMRQVVREESGGLSYELLSQIAGLVDDIRRKDTAVTLTVGDRELARAVRQGERKLGYPIRG